MIRNLLLGGLGVVVAFAVYVRVAPDNAAYWQDQSFPDLAGSTSQTGANFYVAQVTMSGSSTEAFAQLDDIIQGSANTDILAGSRAAGKITYVTHSAVFGFPDYTTLMLDKSDESGVAALRLFGRARYGLSDIGVNQVRIEGWIDEFNEQGKS